MLCAIYARLSKEDEEKQQPESESIQNQKAILLQYAMERDWDVYDIYWDEDMSGIDYERPAFNRMIEAARAKKFQIVLCKTQSRFTRDMELVEKYIHGLFPLWGIRFIAIADNADTAVKGNKKARQINGLVNEWYLEDLSENVRTVLDWKRREGQYIGSFPLYGYQKDPTNKNKLIIDPPAAEVVRQIYQWSLEGHGKQNIAQMLNTKGIVNPTRYKEERGWACHHPTRNDYGLWNKTTVWRILRNEMYTGVMVQGRRKKVSYKSKVLIDMPEDQWYRVEGTHEAIIAPEMFRAVQRNLQLRARPDAAGDAHVWSGLVKCKDCGSTMSKTSNGRSGAGRVSYLRCKLYADSSKQRLCTRHSIRLDRLTELVSARIRHYVHTYYTLHEENILPQDNTRWEAMEQEKAQLTVQLEKRNKALRNLYLDKVSGVLGEEQFSEWNQAFLEEKRRMEARLSQITANLSHQEERNKGLEERARDLLQLQTIPRELAVGLIDAIEVGEKEPDTGQQEVVIHWKF